MGDDETSSPTEQFPTMLDLLLSFSDPPTEVQSENDMHIDDTSDDEDTDAFQTTDSNLKELQRVEEKQDKLIHNINRGLDARRKLLAEALTPILHLHKNCYSYPCKDSNSNPAPSTGRAETNQFVSSLRGRISMYEKRIIGLKERLALTRISSSEILQDSNKINTENKVLQRANARLRFQASNHKDELEAVQKKLQDLTLEFKTSQEKCKNLTDKLTLLESKNKSSESSQMSDSLVSDTNHSVGSMESSATSESGGINTCNCSTISKQEKDILEKLTTENHLHKAKITELEELLEVEKISNNHKDAAFQDSLESISNMEAKNQALQKSFTSTLESISNSSALYSLSLSPAFTNTMKEISLAIGGLSTLRSDNLHLSISDSGLLQLNSLTKAVSNLVEASIIAKDTSDARLTEFESQAGIQIEPSDAKTKTSPITLIESVKTELSNADWMKKKTSLESPWKPSRGNESVVDLHRSSKRHRSSSPDGSNGYDSVVMMSNPTQSSVGCHPVSYSVTSGVLQNLGQLSKSLAVFQHQAFQRPFSTTNPLEYQLNLKHDLYGVNTPVSLQSKRMDSHEKNGSLAVETHSMDFNPLVIQLHSLLALFQDTITASERVLTSEYSIRVALLSRIAEIEAERITMIHKTQTQLETMRISQEQFMDEQRVLVEQAINDKREAMKECAAAVAAFDTLKAMGSELNAGQYRQRILELSTQVDVLTLAESNTIMHSLAQISAAHGLGITQDSSPNLKTLQWFVKHVANSIAVNRNDSLRYQSLIAELFKVPVIHHWLKQDKKDLDHQSLTLLEKTINVVRDQNSNLTAIVEENLSLTKRLSESSTADSSNKEDIIAERDMYQEISNSLGVEVETLSSSLVSTNSEILRLRAQLKELDGCFLNFSTQHGNALYSRTKSTDELITCQRALAKALNIQKQNEQTRKATLEQANQLHIALQTAFAREKVLVTALENAKIALSTGATRLSLYKNAANIRTEAIDHIESLKASNPLVSEIEVLKIKELNRLADAKIEKLSRKLDRSEKEKEKAIKEQRRVKSSSTSTVSSNSEHGANLEKTTELLREEKKLVMEEMRELQSKIRCTVCSKRDRSAIITKCYHTFCKQCIDHVLDSRGRKCPACARNFSAADVHPYF